jgi:hypothetical protein
VVFLHAQAKTDRIRQASDRIQITLFFAQK